MANNKRGYTSQSLHEPRTRVSSSHTTKKVTHKSLNIAKYITLSIIPLAAIVTIIAVIFSLILKPENIVKKDFESVSKDYYENYIYHNLIENISDQTRFEQKLEKYTIYGFSHITLRQLSLFNDGHYSNHLNTVLKYCNKDATYINIFPSQPFDKNDYHIDYHYACTF